MGPPVGDVTLFGPKEASWGPPLVTLSFLDQRKSAGAPADAVTLFGPKEVIWGPKKLHMLFSLN